MLHAMKIDIGSGPHRYEGYTPWDWSLEGDARVLPYEDNSLEEIRASHVLEHIPRHQVNETLRHWVSKLKPGGILRIAVVACDRRCGKKRYFRLLVTPSVATGYVSAHALLAKGSVSAADSAAGVAELVNQPD